MLMSTDSAGIELTGRARVRSLPPSDNNYLYYPQRGPS
jgi:hypothetical protein